ncbi:MAG: hypothetical protein ACR2MX_19205, partial [Cyclobacteriaceae bacterium]
CALFYLGITCTYGQSIAIQSFESSGDTWGTPTFSTAPCTNGNDIWDYVTSLPGITPSDGGQFWGIRDLNGNCGGSGFETITLPNVNVSSFSNVTFSFDYNAISFENNDDLKYELFYDDISQGEVVVVDGVGGNSDNTNGWLTETIAIPGTVTNVSLILSARNNGNNDRGGFDNVKLEVGSAPLANDNCTTATMLTVGTDNTQNVITGTNVGASSSGELPNPSCANYQGNDVWYTAQVPANGILTVETQDAGSNIDTAIELYTGNCGNLTQVACHDDVDWPSNPYSIIQVSGLANTTVYIRVWAYNNSTSGDFNIVAYSTPPPANNDCIDAQGLVVGTDSTQNIVTGTNVGATDSGIALPNNCDGYLGGDVWYTAMVPASGILNIETTNAGGITDTGVAVYTGANCGSLTQIDCDADSGPGFFSVINLTGLPNTLVYIRVWEYQNNNFGDFNIVAYSPECPLSTRWNGSSWNNGLPNAFTSAVINNDYDTATDGSFESCDCQINSNDVVNIRANDYITVHNDLTVNGTLEVRHEGSLVMTNDDGAVNVAGTLNVHKTTTPFDQYDYTYWSSATANETIGSALATSVANRIYSFDTSVFDSSNNSGWTAEGSSATMQAGKGYIAMGPTSGTFPQTQTVVFDGPANNGIIQTPIELSAVSSDDFDDWNLIGNPYPSAIDADLLLSDGLNTPVVGGTIYLWTHNTQRNTNDGEQDYNTNDYATYTFGTGGVAASSGGERPSGIIASGQGFFIEGTSAGVITFSNDMRVNSGNDQFFGTEETTSDPSVKSKAEETGDRIWLDLYTDTGAFNQLLIGFREGASNGIDRFDGLKFGGGWVSFYS